MNEQEDKIHQRLSNIEADIVSMKADIDSMKADIAEIKAQGAKRDERIARMEADIDSMKADIVEIKAELADLREQGAARDERIANIENDIDSMKADIAEIKARLANIENDIDSMKADIAEIKEQGAKRDERLARMERQGAARDERIARMERQGAARDERLARMERQGAARDERLDRMEANIAEITTQVKQINIDMGVVKGVSLELSLARSIKSIASQRFGLRRARVMTSRVDVMNEDMEDTMDEALNEGRITNQQYVRIQNTDFILRARRKQNGSEIWVAVESSYTVGSEDIDRAKESAAALGVLYGVPVIAAVAGNSIPPNLEKRAESAGVQTMIVSE